MHLPPPPPRPPPRSPPFPLRPPLPSPPPPRCHACVSRRLSPAFSLSSPCSSPTPPASAFTTAACVGSASASTTASAFACTATSQPPPSPPAPPPPACSLRLSGLGALGRSPRLHLCVCGWRRGVVCSKVCKRMRGYKRTRGRTAEGTATRRAVCCEPACDAVRPSFELAYGLVTLPLP